MTRSSQWPECCADVLDDCLRVLPGCEVAAMLVRLEVDGVVPGLLARVVEEALDDVLSADTRRVLMAEEGDAGGRLDDRCAVV